MDKVKLQEEICSQWEEKVKPFLSDDDTRFKTFSVGYELGKTVTEDQITKFRKIIGSEVISNIDIADFDDQDKAMVYVAVANSLRKIFNEEFIIK